MGKKPSKPPQTDECTPLPSDGGAGHYAAYEGHARNLRTWLVAYGIGGPVLFLSQDAVWAKLAASGWLPELAAFFLAGVVLQVVVSAVNKYIMWGCYYGEIEGTFVTTRWYNLCYWLSFRFSIEILADIASMGCFAWATYWCFVALTA